jgi:hypothetical protein
MIWKTSEKRMKQKYKTQMEGHSSRLEKAEDRISELEDEMEIKGKTEELLVNSKTFERNMQELTQLHQKTKPENHGY